MNLINQLNTRSISVYAIIILSVLLSGCAVIPDNWAFSKETMNYDELKHIKRIALLDVPIPSNIEFGNLSDAGATNVFGLVGMLTARNTEGNKITSGSVISIATQEELKIHLEKAGIEVVLLEAERTDKSEMLEDYDQFTKVDADAILEVAIVRVGFGHRIGAFGSDELGPYLIYKYRLVSTKDDRILIESNVFYETFYYKKPSSVVGYRLYGPSWHIFADENALKNDPDEAVRRLAYAVKEATGIISLRVTF